MIDFLCNDLRRATTVGPETGKDGAKFTFLKTRKRKTLLIEEAENKTKTRKFKLVVSKDNLFNFT